MINAKQFGFRQKHKTVDAIASVIEEIRYCLDGTRRERPKSALYLSLKKRKTFFWKKPFFEVFEIFFFRKMSHSAEKCKKGDPF